jgi:hypothetical protein
MNMKKSERYQLAMLSVVDDESIEAADKLEIVETLMNDKRIAEWSEKQEEEKKAEEAQ